MTDGATQVMCPTCCRWRTVFGYSWAWAARHLHCRSCATKKRHEDPEYRKKNLEQLARLRVENASDPAYRDKQLQGIAKLWSDPAWIKKHRAKLAKIHKSESWRIATIDRLASMNADPKIQARRLERLREITASSAWQANQREILSRLWSAADFREKQFLGNSLRYLPKSVRDNLTDEDRAFLSLPEVREEIIAATAAALSMEVPCQQ